MFDLWLKDWRRKRIVQRPIPHGWSEILVSSFWYWRVLSESQQSRLLKLIAIFVHEKEIVVPSGNIDRQRAIITVAAAACLMLLGFDDYYCFDCVRTVILTEQPFRQRIQHTPIAGLSTEVMASGVYSKGTPIALSWPDVAHDCKRPTAGRNVVIHEFAHHIDDLDGTLAGDPPFPSGPLRRRWQVESQRAMQQLADELHDGQTLVLDPYGLSSPVEFFAVACEAYFCRPHPLNNAYPDLFDLLHQLFHVDPRGWLEPTSPPSSPPFSM